MIRGGLDPNKRRTRVLASTAQPMARPFQGSISVEMEDDILVQRSREGDRRAFQMLVGRYQKKLFSIIFGMIHHPEDAMDIVQETFLKVYRYLPNFQGNSSFYTWIYRIAVNLCIDFLRREGKHQAIDYDDSLQHQNDASEAEGGMVFCTHVNDPARLLKNKELGEEIQKGILALSPNHRAVILLREVEGMSYEEMAAALQCSKGTVMSRLHHARAKLREYLEAYLGEETPKGSSEIHDEAS